VVHLAWRGAPTESELSEFLAAVRRVDGRPTAEPDGELPRRLRTGDHLVAVDGARIVGYAHVNAAPDAAGRAVGEVYVHPDWRRRGIGRSLVVELVGRVRADRAAGELRLWAFGDHPAAAWLAARCGFRGVREVRRLVRPLSDDLPEPALPAGLRLRTFRPDHDEDAVVDVNRRAFAWHPEQGAMTAADLRAARSESWFRPEGFLLAVDAADTVLGFHWTKVHPDVGGRPMGEVYVLAVDPRARGRGLGGALTVAGLRYLAAAGLDRAMLYVESDNEAALATYRKLGFVDWDVDVQYAHVTASDSA